jgi:DNA-binding NtrC family response regulator
MVMCRGEMINPEDIPYELINAGAPENALDSLDAKVGDFEKELIRKALAETGGNRAKAAELLKANRVTLLAKIKKYGLSLKEEK